YGRRLLHPDVDPWAPGQTKRFIYSFWHETILLPAYRYARTPTKVLISEHADGELIAQACRHLGLGVVRGSTTRGGVKAVREVLELGGTKNVVVTPDGPRGPRRQVQPGLGYLAARTRPPVLPRAPPRPRGGARRFRLPQVLAAEVLGPLRSSVPIQPGRRRPRRPPRRPRRPRPRRHRALAAEGAGGDGSGDGAGRGNG